MLNTSCPFATLFALFTSLIYLTHMGPLLCPSKSYLTPHQSSKCPFLCEVPKASQSQSIYHVLTGTPVLFSHEHLSFQLDYKFSSELSLYLIFLYIPQGQI